MSKRINRPFSALIGPFTDELRSELKAKALERRTDPEHGDLYLVFPGMGPSRYIAESGTVLIDGDWMDDSFVGLRPASLAETLACYAWTSDKFEIRHLRALLPTKPDSASRCNQCEDSSGWMRLPLVDGGTHQVLCGCSGLGWLPQTPWELHPDEITWFLQNNPDLSKVLERAQFAMNHKQYAVASECSRYVLRRDLEDIEALEVLGEANFALGNLKSAVIQFSQLATILDTPDWKKRAAAAYLDLFSKLGSKNLLLNAKSWLERLCEDHDLNGEHESLEESRRLLETVERELEELSRGA